MPIRTEWRAYYGREWRERIRPRILARAGYKCERCAKPDRASVWVYSGTSATKQRRLRRIRVILTVAHLNHDPRDNRDENLAALCQWCHLNHDRAHHRETRARRKDRARPLLAALTEGGSD